MTLPGAPVVDARWVQPAPALPLPPRPHTVFTAVPGTAARLANQGALRVALRPGPLFTLVLALIVLVPMAVIGEMWLLAVAAPVVGIGTPVLGYVTARRRLRRSFDVICAPGATMAVQLGPDALDIGDAHSYVRLDYERISAVRTSGAVVALRVDNRLRLTFPRELFPAPMAEYLRHLIWHRGNPQHGAPPPLPPLPTLLHPQAALVADETTARTLFAAEIREPLARPGVLIRFGLGAVATTGLIGWLVGPGWTALPILMFAIMVYGTVRAIRRPGPEAARTVRHAVPGSVLATQFGADALVYQTRTHLLRTRYADITTLALRRDVAVVTNISGLTVLPRELVPADVVARLRELGVTVVER
ncbi:hypothetical protein [Nocardia sp. NPDC004415]